MRNLRFISTGVACAWLCLWLCWTGCHPERLEGSAPAYLAVPRAEVLLGTAPAFTSELGIKDLWLERGDEFLGVHQLPAVVPVLEPANNDLFLWGGIFRNGLSADRARYPFWQPLELSPDLQPLDTAVIFLQFRYFSDTLLRIPFQETFEGASISLRNNAQGNDLALLGGTNAVAFQGRRAGRVQFSGNAQRFEVVSENFFTLPQGASNDIYAEITYRNTIPFTAGLKYSSTFDVGEVSTGIFFSPSEEWNTVYVHLKPLARQVPQPAAFGLFLRAEGQGRTGQILLDNIRVIYFR